MSLNCEPFVHRTDHHQEKSGPSKIITKTSKEQRDVENSISIIFKFIRSTMSEGHEELKRQKHVSFLKRNIRNLHPTLCCLDSSRPWMVFWIVHSLEILGSELETDLTDDIITFLAQCQSSEGGFGGGPGQYSHLAPTYAAVCALCIIGTEEAYKAIDREKLYKFLKSMKTKDGSFTMHSGGEVDIRGVYCAVSVALLCNVYTEELFKGTSEWLLSCQTYEGGFSGRPGLEAHGGYTYCGVASLDLLKSLHLCQLDSLLHWAVSRQMRFEGGFQGRTNKLVDGCYSFWQGGLFPLIHSVLHLEDGSNSSNGKWLFHQEALQEYLLYCCQYPKGGLVDKPGKSVDFYHTCYTLSGLSIAQHFNMDNSNKKCIVGPPSNELVPVNYHFNIGVNASKAALTYFQGLRPIVTDQNS